MLSALNILLVGVWVGMYLFTTYVVSPAFKEFYPDPAERQSRRRAVGRYYARLNGPLSGVILLVVAAQGFVSGWTWALGAELALLLLIGALVAGHVRQGQRGVLPPAWLTHVTLASSVLLCGAALGAWGGA